MKIIKEITQDKPYLIVYKPAGLPSAPLSPEDKNNAFAQAADQFPQLLTVTGRKECEHGLIHRIDNETSGLLVIAATQEAYDNLLELQKQNRIKKYYTAQCNINKNAVKELEGFPEQETVYSDFCKSYSMESYFRFFGEGRKSVRPVTKNSSTAALKKLGKPVLYKTDVEVISVQDKIVNVEACITNGFRHQVRCHLAWMGLPIIGDQLYNPQKSENSLSFTASKIDISGDIWYI